MLMRYSDDAEGCYDDDAITHVYADFPPCHMLSDSCHFFFFDMRLPLLYAAAARMREAVCALRGYGAR